MLDSRRPVHYANIESTTAPYSDPERYEYRPELGWRWLQRAAFKVLDWIGAHHMASITTFVRTPAENDGLLKSLLGQEGEWIERVHHSDRDGRGAQIYVGPDEYPDLMRPCEHMGMSPVTMHGRIKTQDRYGPKWHDIPITVVPWMVGAVLVPD